MLQNKKENNDIFSISNILGPWGSFAKQNKELFKWTKNWILDSESY